MDVAAARAHILQAADFDEARLAELRSRAVAPGSGPHGVADPKAVLVAVGYTQVWEHRSDKHTYYRLLIDGHELEIQRHRLFLALENLGTYRVYFTAADKLLALEPAAPEEVPDAVAEAVLAAGLDPNDPARRTDDRVLAALRETISRGLGRAGAFSLDDLAANRTGRLTGREQKKLRGESIGCFLGAVLLGGFGAMMATTALSDAPLVSWICAGVTLLAVGGLVLAGIRRRRDASAGRVLAAVGTVPRDSRSSPVVKTDVGQFPVRREAFSVRGFHPHALYELTYRVYYAPRAQEVLSLEPTGDLTPLFMPR